MIEFGISPAAVLKGCPDVARRSILGEAGGAKTTSIGTGACPGNNENRLSRFWLKQTRSIAVFAVWTASTLRCRGTAARSPSGSEFAAT